MNICKQICSTLEDPRPVNRKRYDAGQKRCTVCSKWFEIDGLFCPCCTTKLRTKTRSNKWRMKN